MSIQLNGRIRMKIDTTERWRQNLTFVPLKGEIVCYSDYATVDGVNIPNFKIGDGNAYGVDLPFVGDDIRVELTAHIRDRVSHITDEERAFWNNKVRCYIDTEEDGEGYLVDSDTLIFTTH